MEEMMMKKMMKKIVIICLNLILILMMVTACGTSTKTGSGSGSGKEILRVGMECAYAPFNWTQSESELKNGSVAEPIYGTNDYAYGYDVMVARMLADELDMELQIHKVEWSSIVLGMNSGNYDAIIAGMGYTEERDNSVDFTQAYYLRDNVLIVRKDSELATIKGLSEIDGASATTQIGTIWEQYVEQIPNVDKKTYFETTSEVVMSVITGSVDCAVLDEPTAMSATLSNPDLAVVKFSEDDGFFIPEGQSLNVCIAVKEGDTELQSKLDEALDIIEWDSEKMEELMNLSVTLQPLSK
jgi:putative lysine transport system substrate-binding protein